MASIINANTSGGLISTGDTSGQLQLQTAGTTALTIDSSQNLGLGVTPNAWNADYKAFNYGSAGLIYGRSGGEVAFGTNWYRNAAGTFLYTTTNFASYYAQSSGVHYLFSAPSGTAGNTVTFTQVLSINKGTTLVLENGTSSSGTGIAFPATQSASSDANTLDDYEEGTWTMGVSFGGGTTGITYNSSYVTGSYTKVGNRVFISGVLVLTSKGSSTGSALLTGLPFTSSSSASAASAFSQVLYNTTFTGQQFLESNSSATTANLWQVSALGVRSALTDANFNNNSQITVGGSYTV
jgi:hypothetical protein